MGGAGNSKEEYGFFGNVCVCGGGGGGSRNKGARRRPGGGKRWLVAQRSWEGSKEVIEVTQRSGER